MDCGNTDKFSWIDEGIENYTAYNYRDGEGEFIEEYDREYGDSNCDDSEIQDCTGCGSGNIEEFDSLEEAEEAYLNKTKEEGKTKTLKQFLEKNGI